MRIISLNTWGGRAGRETLLTFFKTHESTTDIYCLQEIWAAPHPDLEGCLAGGVVLDNQQTMVRALQEISAALPNHQSFFRPLIGDNYGLAMFIRKGLRVAEEGELFVYREKGYVSEEDAGDHARSIQYATISGGNRPITVINFHGLWNGKGKTDTEDRIRQSKRILAFMKRIQGDCILCGDFNLLPDTESIRMFESAGLRNLIKEYGITSTRTSFYTKPGKHADYIFVSKGLKVADFKVLPDEVSDHTPLFIEIH